MREHIHTGPYMAFWVFGAWIVLFNVAKWIAIWAAANPKMEWLGHLLAASLSFPVPVPA